MGREIRQKCKQTYGIGLYFSIFFCGCKQPKSIHIVKNRCKVTNIFLFTHKKYVTKITILFFTKKMCKIPSPKQFCQPICNLGNKIDVLTPYIVKTTIKCQNNCKNYIHHNVICPYLCNIKNDIVLKY